MLSDHSYQLLENAATDSLERIRADRARVPNRLKPLLTYIEEHLFDASLDVNHLKRSCGIRDNSVPIQFHSAVGRPPHGYIEDRRLETGCRLLGETSLKIWQVSELLGYSSIQVFSRAFSRWAGQRPTLYRKRIRYRSVVDQKIGERNRFFGPSDLRKALSGELDATEAEGLIHRLMAIYPESRAAMGEGGGEAGEDGGQSTRSLTALIEGDEVERLQAEELLKELERQPPSHRMALVDELQFESPALFHLLRRKSHRMVSVDAMRAVQFAELSLRSIDSLARRFHDSRLMASLRTSGWAWLAHAHVTLDEERAQESLSEAERCFDRSHKFPELSADIAFARGQLLRQQKDTAGAREALEEAKQSYAQCGLGDLAAEVLIAMGELLHEGGHASEAIPLLEEALAEVGEDTEGPVKLALFLRLVAARVESGQHAEASEVLPRARQLSLAYGTSQDRIRLRWLEGLVYRSQERLEEATGALLEARDAYSELHDSVSAALVCLDLAEIYSKEGNLTELTHLSDSMVPLIGTLQQSGGSLGPLKLFHQAAEEQALTPILLEEAREALQHSRIDRAAA